MVAINTGDPADVIQAYMKESGFTFKAVMAGEDAKVPNAYRVEASPTNYLVGPDGKILWSSVGFDEQGLRDAVKKAVGK